MVAHQMEGLSLLMKNYEIHDTNLTLGLLRLVFALADAHVPFFQPSSKRRTKKPGPQTDVGRLLRLQLDVLKYKRPGDRGDLPALKRLLTTPAYRRYSSEESLRKALQRGRRDPLVAVLLQLQARIAPDGWELLFKKE